MGLLDHLLVVVDHICRMHRVVVGESIDLILVVRIYHNKRHVVVRIDRKDHDVDVDHNRRSLEVAIFLYIYRVDIGRSHLDVRNLLV